MKLFNRDISMIVRNAYRIPAYLTHFIHCLFVFTNPFHFLLSYLRMRPPGSGFVKMRDGTIIHLSGHPHDIVTVFIIFIRRDYGKVPAGSRVVDIGANIGAFSLYAARCGASKITAYEPNSEAFQCLQRNIQTNSLTSVISPRQFAATGTAGKLVPFPKKASAYNAILQNNSTEEYELVETISLTNIVEEMGRIDFLKMDCEGAEWDILRHAKPSDLASIHTIRMEYHLGFQKEISSLLESNGYRLQYHMGTKDSGTMWFERSS